MYDTAKKPRQVIVKYQQYLLSLLKKNFILYYAEKVNSVVIQLSRYDCVSLNYFCQFSEKYLSLHNRTTLQISLS